jgi:HlyD family secretion protein
LDRKFKGLVTEVANSANTEGVGADQVTNFTVKIRILQESYQDLLVQDNPNISPFRPGMSATVNIETETANNVVCVPIQAVTLREDTIGKENKIIKENDEKDRGPGIKNECVFVVDGETVKKVWVKTGIQDNDYIEIKEGLAADQEIVKGPYSAISKKLNEGSEIKKKEESSHK